MNNLSDECYLIIFKNVNYLDLFNSCRRTCKRWRYLIDEHLFSFDELILFNRSDYYHSSNYRNENQKFNQSNQELDANQKFKSNLLMNKWFSDYRKVNYNHLIKISKLDLLKSSSFQKIFINLKYLNINFPISQDSFDIEILNEFHHLKHLTLKIIQLKKPTFLYMSKLETLSILIHDQCETETASSRQTSKLTLTASKLKNLSCLSNLSAINFRNPESIKLIQIREDLLINTGVVFVNCEIVHFIDTLKIGNLMIFKNANISRIFPKLKELHYTSESISDISYYKSKSSFKNVTQSTINRKIGEIKGTLNHLLREKSKLFDQDFRIFFFGIEFFDHAFFKTQEINFFDNNLILQLEFYDFLSDDLSYYVNVNYDQIERHFLDSFPENFLDKYCNIKAIECKDVKAQDQFIWFLRRLSHNLVILKIESTNLDQTFYDNLSSNLPSLKLLELINIKNQLNYNFIFDLNQIWQIKIESQIDLDSTLHAFKVCTSLTKFCFFFNECSICISKANSELYNLNCDFKDLKRKSFCMNKIKFKELEKWCTFIQDQFK